MRKVLVFMFIIFAQGCGELVAPAPPPDITGRWYGKVMAGPDPATYTLNIVQNGTTVSGWGTLSWWFVDYAYHMEIAGEITGNDVVMRVYNPQAVDWEWRMVVIGEKEMLGTAAGWEAALTRIVP